MKIIIAVLCVLALASTASADEDKVWISNKLITGAALRQDFDASASRCGSTPTFALDYRAYNEKETQELRALTTCMYGQGWFYLDRSAAESYTETWRAQQAQRQEVQQQVQQADLARALLLQGLIGGFQGGIGYATRPPDQITPFTCTQMGLQTICR